MKASILFYANVILLSVLTASTYADSTTFAAKEKELYDACLQKAATHMEENFCTSQALKRADKELNEVYKKLISQEKKDLEYRLFVSKLKKAQKNWLLFVDAHIASIYPEGAGAHGSYEPLCEVLERTALIIHRIEQLRSFFKNNGDDVCGGFKIE